MKKAKEEVPEKRPGYRSSKKSLWFGVAAMVTSLVPVAGMVLGSLAMKWGKRGRQESEKYQLDMANAGVALGAIAFFLNVLMLSALVSVYFRNKTDIINLGAPR